MTTEPEQPGVPAGRKFDDIASLFGAIVPAPGTPVRPAPRLLPLPSTLPAQPEYPPVVPQPPASPEPVVDRLIDPEPHTPEPRTPELGTPELGTPVPEPLPPAPRRASPPAAPVFSPTPSPRNAPPPVARPRPTEIPWPDAFEPRPNFRKREPRNWSWLLLIPIGIVAAIGIGSVNTRALRDWVGVNVLHREATPASTDSPLLPAPFRNGATTPADTAAKPAATAAATPNPTPNPTPDPTPGATEAARNPFPAIPTSPVPVPPGTEVSPPPVDPAQAAAAPTVHVTIQYRRNIPGADGEARRIAALLQGTGGSVELRPGAAAVKVPTITYYNPADRPAASALALVLANEAANWTLHLGTAKNPPGSLDIAMH